MKERIKEKLFVLNEENKVLILFDKRLDKIVIPYLNPLNIWQYEDIAFFENLNKDDTEYVNSCSEKIVVIEKNNSHIKKERVLKTSKYYLIRLTDEEIKEKNIWHLCEDTCLEPYFLSIEEIYEVLYYFFREKHFKYSKLYNATKVLEKKLNYEIY